MAYTPPVQAKARFHRAPVAVRKVIVQTDNTEASEGTSPTQTSGTGAPTHTEPKGSTYQRTDGTGGNQMLYVATDSVGTWEAVNAESFTPGELAVTTGAMIVGAAGVGSEIDVGGTAQGLPLSDGIGGVTIGTMQDHPVTDHCGMTRFLNPIAAEDISIVAAVLCADGPQILAAQTDYPRCLRIVIATPTNPITGGTVTVNGVGASGEAVAEVVDISAGAGTYITDRAVATITDITVAGLAGGAGAGDSISVGVSAKLGLPGNLNPPSGNFAAYKTVVNDANEAVAGVDATNGTVSPTTAPNAANDYQFYYTYRTAAVSHTIA